MKPVVQKVLCNAPQLLQVSALLIACGKLSLPEVSAGWQQEPGACLWAGISSWREGTVLSPADTRLSWAAQEMQHGAEGSESP